jgi:hypothetical protein
MKGCLPSRIKLGMVSVLCLFTMSVSSAQAATPTSGTNGAFNLTASPLPISLVTTPGKSIATNLRVQNSGTAPVKIKVSLLKFKAAGTNGQPELLKRSPQDTYLDWVNFSKTSFTAEPGAWNDVAMTVKPPKEAAFGYYYAIVFGQDNSNLPLTTAGGKLNGAVATLVLLDVQAPGEKRELNVSSFTASKHLYEYLPASFDVTVHNPGNVHAVPTGDVFISRDHKHDLAVLPVNPNQGNTLPNSNRVFHVEWNDGFPVYTTAQIANQTVANTKGEPVKQLHWDFSKTGKLRFGKYYAHLLLTYNNGTQDVPIDAEVSFWVVPWKLILLAILIPLIPAVAVYLIMRQRTKGFKNRRKYVAGR